MAKATKKEVEVVNNATTEQEVIAPIVSRDNLITTLKGIEAAIVQANQNANTLQVEYQRIACSAILHLANHKDIRVIRNLLDNLPEGMRKKSMATFIDKFAPVSFDEEGEVHYNKEKKLDLAGALALAWWKAAKESVYIPFNFEAEMQKLYDRAVKRFAKADADKGDNITAAHLNALLGVLSEVKKLPAPKGATKKAA